MKILFYGDLQISRKRSDYMEFLQATLQGIYNAVCEIQPDILVNTGDLFDDFGKLDVRDLVYAYQWMSALGHEQRQHGGEHWIVKGNHDIADKEGKVAAIQVMERPSSTIFMDLTAVNVPGLGHVIVVPYTEDYDMAMQALEGMAGITEVAAIITHTDWLGVRPSIKSGHVSTTGLDLEKVQRLFPNTPIFGGHYHTPMNIGNLNLVGSPLHMTFSDILSDIQRGYLCWHTDTGHIDRFANPFTYYCAEVRCEDPASLMAQHEVLEPAKHAIKVKIYVPTSMVIEADNLFSDFLWHATYPIESSRASVEHMADVSVSSTVGELIQKGVSAAGEQYDRPLLTRFGQEAFA